jgi:hypothetical protein
VTGKDSQYTYLMEAYNKHKNSNESIIRQTIQLKEEKWSKYLSEDSTQ